MRSEAWIEERASRDWLRLPVLSAGAEYLVLGHLMRRNILTYGNYRLRLQ